MLAIRQIILHLAQRGIPRARWREILVNWWALHWKRWSGFACEAPVLLLPTMLVTVLYEDHVEPLVPPLLNQLFLSPCVLLAGLLIGFELMARFFYLPRLQELDGLIGDEFGG